jgi:hypothetical protein
LEKSRSNFNCEVHQLEESITHKEQWLVAKQLQYLFELIHDKHLFGRGRPGPIPDEAVQDWDSCIRVLLNKLDHAIGQLLMIQRNTFGNMKWDQCALEKLEMLSFQGDCKAVDDRSQNFQKLTNTVMPFSLINETVEYI